MPGCSPCPASVAIPMASSHVVLGLELLIPRAARSLQQGRPPQEVAFSRWWLQCQTVHPQLPPDSLGRWPLPACLVLRRRPESLNFGDTEFLLRCQLRLRVR